jgi:hypothetical protein
MSKSPDILAEDLSIVCSLPWSTNGLLILLMFPALTGPDYSPSNFSKYAKGRLSSYKWM